MAIKKYSIHKVAVLGSGVMGSQIAAHCVNAGLDVLLLDLKSDKTDNPNQIVEDSLHKLLKMQPAPLALPEYLNRIKKGNFDDDWDKLRGVDWICEAIVENMDIKKKMMARIDKVRRDHTIVSSNTSGLPITKISDDVSEGLQKHFLGTHFFNPPRYMKLLEIIPTNNTAEEVTEYMTTFAQKILGKGVVQCKDTPNFIANRIGVFSMANMMPYAFEGKFRIEEIDYLTGTLGGFSKAATFRTADMAGLDVVGHVAKNLYPNIPNDERQDVFKLDERFYEMVSKNMLGNKSGMGFYKKIRTNGGKEYKVLNVDKFEYESQKEVKFPVIEEAKAKYKTTEDRLKYLVQKDGKVGDFTWEIHRDLFLYSANRIPEFADSIESVDRAMRWGFNWEMGPFEQWDAVGVRDSVERMKKENYTVPESVLKMLESGRDNFYEDGTVYNLASGQVEPTTPPAKDAVSIGNLIKHNKMVFSKKEAALYDMGDGVALFEFRSKANSLGQGVIAALFESFEHVKKGFNALVIGNEGGNFSVGANLFEVLMAVKNKQFKELEQAIKAFQDASLGIRYLSVPVVVAPFNRTLGGGCEFTIHADRVVANHELYAGLVEVGVGLIPAGGGTTEMLNRYMSQIPDDDNADPLLYLKQVFQQIGMAKVSLSAPEARKYNILKEGDIIQLNRDLLLQNAKEEARLMAEQGYQPPPKRQIMLMGKNGFSALKLSMYIMKESRYLSEYDSILGEKLAYVLTGGDLSEPQKVTEDYILNLEREVFFSLLKEKKTLERIQYMLEKGKPLRN
ncbi:MAG TPA: 3-hydroxyacyl-CoA dehydrogenase NAD-binding domain-containing protein [Balneolales bacterium]|nr:3-hydroxyacyl-CoA dehydrogenase NAD-binding domain-containing protein [Balneolales bacterium]